jgi:hypothetical protein
MGHIHVRFQGSIDSAYDVTFNDDALFCECPMHSTMLPGPKTAGTDNPENMFSGGAKRGRGRLRVHLVRIVDWLVVGKARSY